MSDTIHDPEVEGEDEDDENEEFDYLTELFLDSGPDDAIILHQKDCIANDDEEDDRCDCVPVTLQRGAKA